MIKINIVAVGSIKEKYFLDAIEEYKKRLGKFCTFNIIEVDEFAKEKEIDIKIRKEGQEILKAVRGTVILLDIKGTFVSSALLAEKIRLCELNGESEITFVVGGSNGVSEDVKKKANCTFSFGMITMPHQLFRVVLVEQIYRAFSIINNLPYHK